MTVSNSRGRTADVIAMQLEYPGELSGMDEMVGFVKLYFPVFLLAPFSEK